MRWMAWHTLPLCRLNLFGLHSTEISEVLSNARILLGLLGQSFVLMWNTNPSETISTSLKKASKPVVAVGMFFPGLQSISGWQGKDGGEGFSGGAVQETKGRQGQALPAVYFFLDAICNAVYQYSEQGTDRHASPVAANGFPGPLRSWRVQARLSSSPPWLPWPAGLG